MKLNSNSNDLAENKVLILYVLDKLNKDVTNDGLFKIISSINNINYFYFQQTLNDLVETNLVGYYTKEDGTVLKMTTEGKNAFALTKEILPGILVLKTDKIMEKEIVKIEEEASITAEFIPKSEDEYTVSCKIVENKDTIFEVKTFAGSRDRAKKIADNWKNNASKLYPEILNLLLDDKNN